mgnify:FL=1
MVNAGQGWIFDEGTGVVPDIINDATRMHKIYTAADQEYSSRVTVTVLWDKDRGTIVSNESYEIIRMLNSAFDRIGAKKGDYYPEAHRNEINAVNERIYHILNNGVYKAGFATSQKAYEKAIIPHFETLDWLEEILNV